MYGFTATCLSNILLTAILVAAAWYATRRRRPALGHALYLLALLKLVTPPMVALELWSGWSGTIDAASGLAPSAAQALAATVPVSAASPGAAGTSATPLPALLPWVWAVGTAVALGLVAWRMFHFDRWLRGLRRASSRVQTEVDALAQRLGLRRGPTALVVDAAVSPLVCPSSRGTCLVLPAALLARLSTDGRETVIVHELAHLRRRDTLVRFVECLVVAAWWWLPLVYAVRRGLRHAEEVCCDAWVLATLPGRGDTYAAALVTASAVAHDVDLVERPVALPAPACGLGAIPRLRDRLRLVATPRASGHRLGRAGWLATVGLAVCLLPLVACQSLAHVVMPPAAGDDRAYTMGAVRVGTASTLKAKGKTTVLEALTKAQPTEHADLTRVFLFRRADPADAEVRPTVLEIDVRQMIMTGNTTHNVELRAGDVLYVPRTGEPSPTVAGTTAPPILTNKSLIEETDLVSCIIDPAVLNGPGAGRLRMLTELQRIGPEGSIACPFVGNVKVIGLTTTEAAKVLNQLLSRYLAIEVDLQVRASLY